MERDRKVVIDQKVYEFFHIDVLTQQELLIDTMQLLGPALEKKGKGLTGITSASAEDNGSFAELLGTLFITLDPKKTNALMRRILDQTVCEGVGRVRDKFDTIFTSLAHLWKVVIAAYKFYFADFFQGALSMINTYVTGPVDGGTQPEVEMPSKMTQKN